MSADSRYSLSVRVYWEDTDASGIVYYANYLRFLERARTEWLRVKGYQQNELARRHGVVFVVRAVALDFLRPARLDDTLSVTVALTRLGPASVELDQRIERDGEGLVAGTVKLACVRIGAIQPARIPRELYAAFVG